MPDPARLLNELQIDRKHPQPKRRRWPLTLAAIVVIGGGIELWLSGRPITVESTTARSAATDGPPSVLDASGYVTARRIATVSSKITGKVLDVLIEEGMRVEANQVLARLDAADAQAQQALAASQLAATQAQLAEAQAQLKLAEITLKRHRELAATKLVPQSVLDQAQAERDSRDARLHALHRQVEVARDQLAVTVLGVDNTVVRAPFSGVIVAKAAQPGEMVSPLSAGGGFTRTGIGTLVDMDSLEVQVDVNEAYIGRVQPQQPIQAVLNAYPEWKIPGAVIAIIPTADRTRATVKVRIALNSKDSRIVPDMGVRVSFLEEFDPAAPPPIGAWIPASAVRTAAGKSSVFVVAEGFAREVLVKLGEKREADQRVLDGLEGGESVILAPPEPMRDGSRISVKQD